MVKQRNSKQSRRCNKARRINRGGGREDSTGTVHSVLPQRQGPWQRRARDDLLARASSTWVSENSWRPLAQQRKWHGILWPSSFWGSHCPPTGRKQRKAVSSWSVSFLSRLFGKELSCHPAPNQHDSPIHSTWDRRGSVNPWASATAGHLFLL